MTAVFLHIFYPHLWSEIVGRIKAMPFEHNLYINLVQGHTDNLNVQEHFPNAVVRVSPNQGMDPGGNLRMLNYWKDNGKDEEYIVFLHSKGCRHGMVSAAKESETSELRNLMWSIVTPEKYPAVAQAFQSEDVGMAGVKQWHRYPGLDHGDPIPECRRIAELLRLNNYEQNSFGFIGGTMFFVRSKIFRKVFGAIDIEDMVSKLPEYSNGGDIHALERIFGYAVLSEGYKIQGV